MSWRHAVAFAGSLGLLACALFLLNGWNAYHPTDDGFVLAYSWRIVHGEVPYRDFLYYRSPLTPYLHALELLLPEGWAIHAGRLAFYAELAIAGGLVAVWSAMRLGARASGQAVAIVLALYLFAVHDFAPMPWPTVDGVLLATGAATATLFAFGASGRRRFVLLGTASVLIALAALAKQAFAPLAVLLGAWAALAALRGRSPAPLLAACVPGALLVSAVAAGLAIAGALPEAIYQVLAPASLRPTAAIPWSGDIFDVGIAPYLGALDPFGLAVVAAGFALGRWPERAPTGRVAYLVVIAGVAAMSIELQFDKYLAGRHLWWMFAGLLAGAAAARRRDEAAETFALGAVVAVAWCSSISFGYETPLLGLVGAGALLARAVARVAWPPGALAIALTAGLTAASVVVLDLERPYRDLPRAQQVSDLGAIYARFGHLYTNATNAERFLDLRDLSTRYAIAKGRPFVVFPEYPLIQYLSDTRSVLSIDWLEPQEYFGREDRLRSELLERDPIVLIAREPAVTVGAAAGEPAECTSLPHQQALVRLVVAEWRLIAEGRYFCVYGPP